MWQPMARAQSCQQGSSGHQVAAILVSLQQTAEGRWSISMNLQSVIDQVAQAAGVQPPVAEKAVGIILSVLQQELDPAVAARVMAVLPGGDQLAQANAVSATGGGMISTLVNSVLGRRAGICAAGFTALESTGLTITQIEAA